MSYFKFENKNIFYNEVGEGTPLLLLHGNTASSNMFNLIVDKYKNNYKVILIDFLGHGQSDRLDEFPIDLWFYEAKQVIEFLKQKDYSKVYLIGSSGGALVAINVALEASERVSKVIADSFEGECALTEFTSTIKEDRENSKKDINTKMFYEYMHGNKWQQVVDNDTQAIIKHSQIIKDFFHRDLNELKAKVLFTGSLEDEFVSFVSPTYFQETYTRMIEKIGHGKIYLFQQGGHPALLSNLDEFVEISMRFFKSD